MADLSTKKISEAYPGLIHSVQSGNAISGTVTTTNLQLKTGSDGATPFHFDNNKVAINQTTDEVTAWKASSGAELEVRQTTGFGGHVFAGTLTVWQGHATDAWGTAREGGQINLKDGASKPNANGSFDSYWIDNYRSDNGHQIRMYRSKSSAGDGGTQTNSKIMTLMEKNEEAYIGLGTIGNPTERLHLDSGKIKIYDMLYGSKVNECWVNASTSGTYPGDDNNPGSRTAPYNSLHKAMLECPSGGTRNIINLYTGETGTVRTYNITEYAIPPGTWILIRTVHCDASNDPDHTDIGYPVQSNASDTLLEEYRDNTIIAQSLVNPINGATGNHSRLDLHNNVELWIYGVSIHCSFPRTGARVQQHTIPFRAVGGDSTLRIGRWNSSGAYETIIKFTTPNTDSGGTAVYPATGILCADQTAGRFIGTRIRWENDPSTVTQEHPMVWISGMGQIEIRQKNNQIPDTGHITDQYNTTIVAGGASSQYS